MCGIGFEKWFCILTESTELGIPTNDMVEVHYDTCLVEHDYILSCGASRNRGPNSIFSHYNGITLMMHMDQTFMMPSICHFIWAIYKM